MSSDKDSPAATPVWCTGPEQIEVQVTGEIYKVDVDIAKRMGIIQEGHESESPFRLAGCTSQDFERALTFCANDRSSKEPPSPELEHIIKQAAPAPEESTSTVEISFANLTLVEEDEEDGSYAPSVSESSDSEEEISDTDPTDIGTANITAELEEYEAKKKEKEQPGDEN